MEPHGIHSPCDSAQEDEELLQEGINNNHFVQTIFISIIKVAFPLCCHLNGQTLVWHVS